MQGGVRAMHCMLSNAVQSTVLAVTVHTFLCDPGRDHSKSDKKNMGVFDALVPAEAKKMRFCPFRRRLSWWAEIKK